MSFADELVQSNKKNKKQLSDPLYLRKSIANAKAEPILRQIAKEKILIGISAGAIVQQKDMSQIARFTAETRRKPQGKLSGIGIVDHEIMPHYQQFCERYFDVEKRIRQYELETGHKVIRLSDGEGFTLEDLPAY